MKLTDKNNYENILAYMVDTTGATNLTDHEQVLYKRWNEAWTLLSNFHTTGDAAAILQKRFGISRATAFRDCANATSLFGDLNKTNKEGIKHLSSEMIKQGAKIHRAMNDGDGLIKAGVAFAKVNGVNITDPDLPDFSKLQPHTYTMGVDALTVRAIHYLISTGRIDLGMVAEAMQHVAEDVEFTEVKPVIEIGNGG